jgi:hypothetical protein
VEAKVRREVAIRKHGHEKMNEERKLTDEQRREKLENKKVDEEKRGIYGAVFKYVFCELYHRSYVLTLYAGSRRCQIQHIDSKYARTPSRRI